MITEDYISFETAKLLKEKGFDEKCHMCWDEVTKTMESADEYATNSELLATYISAPTIQMAMKWLREVHYCHIVVDYTFKADAGLTNDYVSYVYGVENAKTFVQHTSDRFFDTYEESCEEAIKYCLENLI